MENIKIMQNYSVSEVFSAASSEELFAAAFASAARRIISAGVRYFFA